jgi:hypothetical protein
MIADNESGTTAGWYGEGITGCRLHRDEAPALGPDDDIEAAFEVFWIQRREAAVAAICDG